MRPDREHAFLGVPVLLMVHNYEEMLTIERALPRVVEHLPASLAAFVPTLEQMYFALALATVIPWVIFLIARFGTRAGVALLLLLQCIVLVNVAWHAAAAVFLRGYAPGLVTAIAFNLPFSIYLLRRAYREEWIRRRTLLVFLPLAVLLHGPLIFGVIQLARG
ncbi:MAG TPA: HXXEE domain-containing protein [Longimicrobium sp.]